MPKLITVVYNREDASEVIDVQVREYSPLKDTFKKGVGVKQLVDLGRRGDPTQFVFKYTQVDQYQRDVLKSSRLTDEQKAKFFSLLEGIEFWDNTAFAIGDTPPVIPPVVADAPPKKKPLVVTFVDP